MQMVKHVSHNRAWEVNDLLEQGWKVVMMTASNEFVAYLLERKADTILNDPCYMSERDVFESARR
jgi:hypothetical protein